METISLQIVFFGKHFFFKTLSVFFSLERVFLVGILSSIHVDKKVSRILSCKIFGGDVFSKIFWVEGFLQ